MRPRDVAPYVFAPFFLDGQDGGKSVAFEDPDGRSRDTCC